MAYLVLSVAAVLIAVSLIYKLIQYVNRKSFFDMPGDVSIKPLELDKEKRKAVIRRRFRPELVPEDLDAIVVGSGMGGLTCAGLLARAGKKVLVLEKHDRLGGCTHTFKKKGFEFDIGIHYVGNLDPGSMNRVFIDFVTDGQLQWNELDKNYDQLVIDRGTGDPKTFDYHAGRQSFFDSLCKQYPDERQGIKKFFDLLKEAKGASSLYPMFKILPKFLMRLLFVNLKIHKLFFRSYDRLISVSTQEVLDSITTNEELKLVLSYCFGDYGTEPNNSPFFMHAMLMNHFLRTGGFYPIGGSSEIAYQMIPGIERAGGACFSGAPVGQIMFEGGRACGVKMEKSELEIRAPIIISSAGVNVTYDKLIPLNIYKKYQPKQPLKDVEAGASCFQIFIGLEGTAEELDLPCKNFWITRSTHVEQDMQKYLALDQQDAANEPVPLLFLSFPCTKDPTWKERFPGKSNAAVVTFSNLKWFQQWENENVKRRGMVYDDLKQAFVDQAWSQIVRLYPRLKDKVSLLMAGTPLSHQYYINSTRGEIYGLDHTMSRFSIENSIELRPESPCPGLFLTGQDVFTCGFMGAAFSGLLTASSVLDRYLIIDLIKQVGVVRKNRKNR